MESRIGTIIPAQTEQHLAACDAAVASLKLPYHTPRLEAYGRLSEVTQAAGGNVDDGGGGSLTI